MEIAMNLSPNKGSLWSVKGQFGVGERDALKVVGPPSFSSLTKKFIK